MERGSTCLYGTSFDLLSDPTSVSSSYWLLHTNWATTFGAAVLGPNLSMLGPLAGPTIALGLPGGDSLVIFLKRTFEVLLHKFGEESLKGVLFCVRE